MESDFIFYLRMIRNIFITFFKDGVWVVGFFFILLKTFDNKTLRQGSIIIIAAVLSTMFLYAFFANY
jgi:hypothetical protein